MYILSVDSSTRYCSVAIHQDGEQIFSADNFTEKSASSYLTVLIQTAVDATGIALTTIDAFAVGKGPGSYTGLRVATSVVKGLCFALNKPLIGVNTLQAMSQQVADDLHAAGKLIIDGDLWLVPMIDARRMEVYTAVYDRYGREVEETYPLIVEQGSFDPLFESHKLVFFGDGASKCQPLWKDHPQAIFWEKVIHPRAAEVGKIASRRYEQNEFEDVATFEPFYLKEFIGKPVV